MPNLFVWNQLVSTHSSVAAAIADLVPRGPAAMAWARIEIEEETWGSEPQLTLPPALWNTGWVSLLRIRGAGPQSGRTRWTLRSEYSPILLMPGSGVRFERIDFVFERERMGWFHGIHLQTDTRLYLKDCELLGPAWAENDPAFGEAFGVATTSDGSPAVHVRLRGARLEGWQRGLSIRGHRDQLPSEIDVEASGFRRCGRGIHAEDVPAVSVTTSRLDHNGTGVRLTHTEPLTRMVNWSVVDNQFTDNLRGVAVLRGDQVAPEGAPVPWRVSATVERNEFRAPNGRAFPRPFPVGSVDGESLHAEGECRGVVVRLARGGPTLPNERSILRVRCNLFHLLDTGIDLRAPDPGVLVIDHNTFVGNSIRSILIRDPPFAWNEPGPRLIVARNVFLGRDAKPWLATAEGSTAGRGDDPALDGRYLFGAIELGASWPPGAINPNPLLAWIAIVQNLFQGHEGPAADLSNHTLVYHRPLPDTALFLQRRWSSGDNRHAGPAWGNVVRSGSQWSPILRLPRVRLFDPQNEHHMVSFDAHLVAAPSSKGDPFVWTGVLGDLVPEWQAPSQDLYGEAWRGPGVGAGNPEPRWKQFPILSGGGSSVYAAWCSDAVQWHSPYAPKDLPNGGLQPLSDLDRDALFESFYDGVATVFDSLLSTALGNGLDLVPALPLEASDADGRVTLTYDGIDIPVVGGSSTTLTYSDAFRAHWFGRATLFIQALREHLSFIGADPGRIWMWFGEPAEMYSKLPSPYTRMFSRQAMFADLTVFLRQADAPPLASYLPGDNRPHQHWLRAGLVTQDGAMPTGGTLDPWRFRNRSSVVVSPPESVWLGSRFWGAPRTGTCVGNPDPTTQDDFGVDLELSRDDLGATRPVLGVTLGSMYFSYFWSDHPDWIDNPSTAIWNVNRSLVGELARRYREACENVRVIQDMNLERVTSPAPVFHNPGLLPPGMHGLEANDWAGLAAHVPENHARHDFWAGMHHADALWLYGWDHRGPEADTTEPQGSLWRGYRRGAEILRNHPGNPRRPQDSWDGSWDGFREAMANGERILGTTVAEQDAHIANPVDWIRVRVDAAVVQETDYGRPEDVGGGALTYLGRTDALALRAVQWSARRLGNVVWLIVSHGYRPDSADSTSPIGSFGFDSNRTIVGATVLDSTGGAPPFLFSSDASVNPNLGGWRNKFTVIDAMLIRIEIS